MFWTLGPQSRLAATVSPWGLRSLRPLAAGVLGLAAVAQLNCTAPDPGPRAPEVANEELGIAFATLPEGYEVEANEGSRLTFNRPGDGGRVRVEVGEAESRGINLVEVIRKQKEAFLAEAGGEYFGQRELGTPLGPAYYARGRFDVEGTRVEETRVFQLHPTQNRLLIVSYRYPAAEDSSERINDFFVLLGELEATASGEPVPE